MSRGTTPVREADLTEPQRRAYAALTEGWQRCSEIAARINANDPPASVVYLTSIARVLNLLARGPLVERKSTPGRAFTYSYRLPRRT